MSSSAALPPRGSAAGQLAPRLVTLGLLCVAALGAPLLPLAAYHGARGAAVEPYARQAAALRRLALDERNGFALFAAADGALGAAFFSCWVLFRERSLAAAAAWNAAICLTGYGACSVYLVRALADCGGDLPRFWMGARAPPAAPRGKEE